VRIERHVKLRSIGSLDTYTGINYGRIKKNADLVTLLTTQMASQYTEVI